MAGNGASTKQQFVHTALSSNTSIRLVSIQSAKLTTDPLVLQLNQFKSSDSPPYYSLSYTWGCPADDLPPVFDFDWDTANRQITINGHIHLIRPNLYLALIELRLRMRPHEFVWIDALCIDQGNEDEKAEQVLRMSDIYSSVQMTMIWLGPAGSTGDAAMQVIREFGSSWRSRPKSLSTQDKMTMPLTIPDKITEPGPLLDQYLSLMKEELKHAWKFEVIQTVIKRRYWSRAWVIQEVVCSPRAAIMQGRQMIVLHDLLDCHNMILQHCAMLKSELLKGRASKDEKEVLEWWQSTPATLHLNRFFNAWLHFQRRLEQDSAATLCLMRNSKSSLAKDKIFAALGYLPRVNRMGIRYNDDLRDVLINIAVDHIKHTSTLRMLHHCRERSDSGIPSWVPDWTVEDHTKGPYIGDRGLTPAKRRYSASGLDQPLATWTDREGGKLMLIGREFDIVGEIHHRPVPEDATVVHIAPFASNHPECIGLYPENRQGKLLGDAIAYTVGDRRYPYTNESLRQAMVRTLLSGELTKEEYTRMSTEATRTSQYLHFELQSGLHDVMLAMSRRGYFSLIPQASRVGDVIVTVLGADVPYVLRRRGSNYTLIGACYVHGIMYGEAWDKNRIAQQARIITVV